MLAGLLFVLALVPAAPASGAVKIQAAAGTGVSGFAEDGGPATAAALALLTDVVAIPGGGAAVRPALPGSLPGHLRRGRR